MPGLTESISNNITLLYNEDNLIRYVFPPHETDIRSIKSIAHKTKACIEIIIANIINYVNENQNEPRLPDEEIGKALIFKFEKTPFEDNIGSH